MITRSNPGHPEGRHKARVFRAALGFTQGDAERLRQMILAAARTEDAKVGPLLTYGQMYTVDFKPQGLSGTLTIRTGWVVAKGTDFPRLVTCYVR